MAKRPGILFITTDEQHIDTVYRTDMPYALPALHGLMACSDVYRDAYSASPVCLPARCTWMTGLSPYRSGCISNHFGASLPLPDQIPNLFTCLKEAGELADYPHAAETHPDSWTGRKALEYLDRCSADQPHVM